jgi:hypothetical protein
LLHAINVQAAHENKQRRNGTYYGGNAGVAKVHDAFRGTKALFRAVVLGLTQSGP